MCVSIGFGTHLVCSHVTIATLLFIMLHVSAISFIQLCITEISASILPLAIY